jgi:hypothetical protein
MTDILHLYAQPFPHEEARIIGTREGLRELQKALNKVLSATQEHPKTDLESFTADGEGYHVKIQMLSTKEMDELRLPYTDFCK